MYIKVGGALYSKQDSHWPLTRKKKKKIKKKYNQSFV